MNVPRMHAAVASSKPHDDRDNLAPELSLYRHHAVALLRRYFSMSVELGRLPGLLGRQFFRSRVRSCRVTSFEDAVIFVHDIERCVQRLHPFEQQLIARCVLQEYTQDEAARLLSCSRQTVHNRLPKAIDALTAMLMENGLMVVEKKRPAAAFVAARAKTCEKNESHPRNPAIAAEKKPSAVIDAYIPHLAGCGFPVVNPPAAAFVS